MVGDDGGTEPETEGAPFRSSLDRIPFQVGGRADHFSEACPANGRESSGNPMLKLYNHSKLT